MEGHTLGLLLFATFVLLPFSAAAPEHGIDIYSMHVDCKVTSRFAHNIVTSRVVNRANGSREATFEVELPKTAFITNFTMTIDGVNYPGTIKKKEEAQEQYNRAISRGESAGLVKATGRLLEKFEVSVNVAAQSKVTFELIYEELLKRKLGNYQLLIKVKPKQLVKHFQIDVHIFEPQGIRTLDTSSNFLTNELSEALTKTVSETKAHILFKPTIDQQRKKDGLEETLLDGDLMINYDVKRGTSAGDVQIINGYFVHYFAPSQMPALPKNVVFVIDTSGSMYGKKIVQTREALLKILEDLSPEDHFNLITFHAAVSRYQNVMLKANKSNIEEAKAFVKSIQEYGATDINSALLSAVQILKESEETRVLPERSVSMIIMLTDGQPTSGETNIERIQANVKTGINKKYALYCLGFGFDVDYKFLEKMALENGGLARRIYEDSDSALQLQGFYQEVANPILMEIQLQYPEDSISHLTENSFRQLFEGSEIVVAGKIDKNDVNLFKAEIKAQTHASDLVYKVEENITEKEDVLKQNQYVFGNFIERLWAYLTIQQLLEKIILARGDVKKNVEEEALQLSLKYSFVTSLTSMVVTKPEDQEKAMVANKPTEDSIDPIYPDRIMHARKGGSRMIGGSGSSQVDSDPFHQSVMFASIPGAGRRQKGDRPISGSNFPSWGTLHRPVPLPTQISTKNVPLPTQRSTKNVDYPDFIVQLPTQSDLICLNVIGDLDDSVILVADPNTGIFVDGRTEKLGQKSYFVSFEIEYKDLNVSVTASKDGLTIQSHQGKIIMDWNNRSSLKLDSMEISFVKRSFVIKVDGKVTINLSYVRSGKHLLRLHLRDVHQFSNLVTGLFGRFYVNTSFVSSLGEKPTATEKLLSVDGQEMKATKTTKKNFKTNADPADTISCWTVDVQQS
ncbi:inter-alpha-trypsin inhibitor heavy chain H4-like isoform X2 [Lissotriton helveticus]